MYKQKESVTYKMIKENIEVKYGFELYNAYCAKGTWCLGLLLHVASNMVEELKNREAFDGREKEVIRDALKFRRKYNE